MESILASLIDVSIPREITLLIGIDLMEVEEAGRESNVSDQADFEICSRRIKEEDGVFSGHALHETPFETAE